LILFEAGFLVAGTVLPLVLVHLFGRLLPGWMLILPGFAIGGGMMAYFGVGLIQMIVATIQGEPSLGDDIGFPNSFLLVRGAGECRLASGPASRDPRLPARERNASPSDRMAATT